MADPVFEAVLTERARAFIDDLAPAQAQQAWRIIHMLEADPSIDQRTKFDMTVTDQPLSAYLDENFWIFYHLVDDAFVVIDALAPSSFSQDWVPPSP